MHNFDQQELDKFQSIGDQWWNAEGNFKMLHIFNPKRIQYIESFIGEVRGKKILDIGCGGGLVSEGLAKLGAKVTGIDLGEKAIESAKKHALENNLNINYRLISVQDLASEMAQTNEKFDHIVCMEMLEHVPQPEEIIAQAQTMLQRNGLMFLSTINRNFKSFMLLKVAAEYVLNILDKGTHDFKKFIKPSELIKFCNQSGLNELDIKGYHYNLLKKSFYLNQDPSANYISVFKNNR